MYCLIIYLNTDKRQISFFYSYNEALKHIIKWLVNWLTNYYDVHYSFDDFTFPLGFWHNPEHMIYCIDNMLNYISEEEKEPSLSYPVKYNLEEIKFND
jgi:hypothetical protein